MIQAVVLPDGHTPPNRLGGAHPNEAEIPTHLRPVWQSFASLPTPVPAIGQAIRIQIPAIGVDAPVVQGDGWEQLKRGVAQHIGTPNPVEIGNMVLSERYIWRSISRPGSSEPWPTFSIEAPV